MAQTMCLPSSKPTETIASHPYLSPPSPSSPTPLLQCPRCLPFTSISSLTSVKTLSQPPATINTSLNIQINNSTITKIQDSYKTDPWCHKLISATTGMPNLQCINNLWFLDQRWSGPICSEAAARTPRSEGSRME